MGADHVFKIEKDMTEDNIVKVIKDTMGEAPVISLDCTGAELCVRVALKATKTGGTVVLVGMGKDEQTVPLTSALIQEIDIRGVFRYCNDYPLSIEMVKTGKINVMPLITHQFKMEETSKAFQTAISGEGNPIKILIYPNKTDFLAK